MQCVFCLFIKRNIHLLLLLLLFLLLQEHDIFSILQSLPHTSWSTLQMCWIAAFLIRIFGGMYTEIKKLNYYLNNPLPLEKLIVKNKIERENYLSKHILKMMFSKTQVNLWSYPERIKEKSRILRLKPFLDQRFSRGESWLKKPRNGNASERERC